MDTTPEDIDAIAVARNLQMQIAEFALRTAMLETQLATTRQRLAEALADNDRLANEVRNGWTRAPQREQADPDSFALVDAGPADVPDVDTPGE